MIPAQATYEGSCAACGCDFDEWTPRCETCRERHRGRARNSGDPSLMDRYHAEARLSYEQASQETARRRRDGEIRQALPPRGERGRWVTA